MYAYSNESVLNSGWTDWAPTDLVSLQPIKSCRWRSWPVNASCNWVDLLQVNSFSSCAVNRPWCCGGVDHRTTGSHLIPRLLFIDIIRLAKRTCRALSRLLSTANSLSAWTHSILMLLPVHCECDHPSFRHLTRFSNKSVLRQLY